MQCTHVSQFLRLGCVLYVVTALEAYWCTKASAALLLSLVLAQKDLAAVEWCQKIKVSLINLVSQIIRGGFGKLLLKGLF